jgi:DNA invertase Pin-like site-specific DNA recombinase
MPSEKVFSEPVSSVARQGTLEPALVDYREGDVLVVTKLDRLARSMANLVAIISRLKARGVALNILATQLDTTTPTGKLMLNLMGSFAEFEREIMLERQREGVAKAKAEGKYKGRVPTAQRRASEVVQLRGQGVKAEEIDELGPRRLDVGQDEIESLCRAWHGRRDSPTKNNRARRAWRRELHEMLATLSSPVMHLESPTGRTMRRRRHDRTSGPIDS